MNVHEQYEYESGPFESAFGEFEGPFEFAGGETYGESAGIAELVSETMSEGSFGEMSAVSPLSEAQEIALATELLEITSEEELEQFIGGLLKKAAGAVGKFAKSGVGQALGGVLKKVAKTALPMAAGALGNVLLPGVGGALGSKLGGMAANLFELEEEVLMGEQGELEVARRVVRLTAAAGQNAAQAPAGMPPAAVAQRSLTQAARQHAPGLLDPRVAGAVLHASRNGAPAGTPARSGRWVRRGQKIVVIGA